MAKNERGVYEPPSDKIRVYDGDDDDLDEEGSRLPLLIVIALLVLAAFGGVVWLAYTQGVQRGRDGGPRIIDAEQGPVKTAPANPGGATPYKGLKIYEQPAPSDDESDAAESGQQTAPVAPPVAPPVAKAETKQAPAVSKPAAAAVAPPPAKVAAPKQVEAPKAVVTKPAATAKPVAAKAEAPPKAAPAVSAPARRLPAEPMSCRSAPISPKRTPHLPGRPTSASIR